MSYINNVVRPVAPLTKNVVGIILEYVAANKVNFRGFITTVSLCHSFCCLEVVRPSNTGKQAWVTRWSVCIRNERS